MTFFHGRPSRDKFRQLSHQSHIGRFHLLHKFPGHLRYESLSENAAEGNSYKKYFEKLMDDPLGAVNEKVRPETWGARSELRHHSSLREQTGKGADSGSDSDSAESEDYEEEYINYPIRAYIFNPKERDPLSPEVEEGEDEEELDLKAELAQVREKFKRRKQEVKRDPDILKKVDTGPKSKRIKSETSVRKHEEMDKLMDDLRN